MKYFFLVVFILSSICIASAQQTVGNGYPKTTGYISVVHPIVTFDRDGATYNFTNYYTVGFPTGINILKSDKFGYSFEVVPFIKAIGGSSKTSNVLFHPGIMFRRPHGFTIITRMAFETAGRYGTTLVFNKVIKKTATNSYFISMPVPFRFGNDQPASVGFALQLGVTF